MSNQDAKMFYMAVLEAIHSTCVFSTVSNSNKFSS